MFPLSPLDSPHQPLFMGQGCVLSPAQKGGFSCPELSPGAAFQLFCSSPVEVQACCSQGNAFSRLYWTQHSFFSEVFLFAVKICCAGNFSCLCFIRYLWGKEEKRLYKLPNPILLLLSLPHILWHFHQARGVSTAGIGMAQLAGGLPWPPTIALSCQPCPSRLIIHPSAYFHEICQNSKIFKF